MTSHFKFRILQVPYTVEGPREGDVPAVFGSASKAERELGWKPKRELEEMCKRQTVCLVDCVLC